MTEKDWICDSQLGSGGFGIVHVWRNKITSQKYALKKCKFGSDHLMTARHKTQWCQEVDIMLRLDHMNVVKCYTIPPGLDPGSPDLPSLCMEFCELGDLRRVLNKPENCRGLTESQILPILNDVTSALGYLHNRRIIHRDLKPENVVLKKTDARIVYKLIDLGYAKELGVSSLAKSFVGTLQYVAPELFLEHDYTKSVDYWSLGLLCHEIVTGQRPFLPHLSPGHWVDHVEQKQQQHIAIVETIDGKIQYMDHLVPESRISKKLALSLENWLCRLVDWNSEARGRDEQLDIVVFNQLNNILRTKRLNVFNMKTKTMSSFSSQEERFQFSTLEAQISEELNVGPENQLLLTDHGYRITREDDLHQFLEAELPLFLVDLGRTNLSAAEQMKCVQCKIPQLVQLFLRDTKRKLQDYHQRLMYIHGYHFIAQENESQRLFSVGMKTLFAYVKTFSEEKLRFEFEKEFIKVKSKLDFFTSSLKHDITRYEEQARGKDRITSSKMINSWKQNKIDLTAMVDTIRSRISILDDTARNGNTKLQELRSQPVLSDPASDPALKEFESKSLKLFDVLRRERPSSRLDTTPRDIAQVVVRMLRRRDELLKSSCQLLVGLRQLLQDTRDAATASSLVSGSLTKADNSINKAQFRRQSDVWTLLAAAIKYTPQQKETESSPGEENGIQHKLDKDSGMKVDTSTSEKVIEESERLRQTLEKRMRVLESCLQE